MSLTKIVSLVLLAAVAMWSSQAFAAEAAAPVAAPAAPAAPAATTAPAAPAAPIASAASPHWHDFKGAWADAFHHPIDNLELGLDLRLREVYTHNMFSLDDQFGDTAGKNNNDNHWQRYRTRLSANYKLTEDVTFNSRLVWEFWTIDSPDSYSGHVDGLKPLSKQDTDFREVIFDRMNLTFKNAFDAPMTLVIGRQDIMLGTGWLVAEGTPADGSRTVYFDAARATIDLSDKTKLDLIGLVQYDDEEKWLSPFNHREWIHSTQKTDETGFIAYLTDKSFENTTLEGYYIYKSEEPSEWSDGANGSGHWWDTAEGQDAEIHTFGGRVAQNLDSNWSYSAEVAKQFGKRNEESMTGLGSNNSLKYAFNDELKNEMSLMYEYLSGDNKSTSQSEKFDTLWGDYPQAMRGGDLQSYIWTFEGALGEVANLHRTGVKHSFKPAKEWTMDTLYNLMWADQNGAGQTPSAQLETSNNSYFRGQMITGLLTYQCCKNFKTQFLCDYFIPGSYYDQSNQDHAIFARINMEWTF